MHEHVSINKTTSMSIHELWTVAIIIVHASSSFSFSLGKKDSRFSLPVISQAHKLRFLTQPLYCYRKQNRIDLLFVDQVAAQALETMLFTVFLETLGIIAIHSSTCHH